MSQLLPELHGSTVYAFSFFVMAVTEVVHGLYNKNVKYTTVDIPFPTGFLLDTGTHYLLLSQCIFCALDNEIIVSVMVRKITSVQNTPQKLNML